MSTPRSLEMEVVRVFRIWELTSPSWPGWLRLARVTREAKASGRRSACSSRCSATSCVMGVVNCLVGEMGAAGVIGRLSRRGRVLCPALPDDGRRNRRAGTAARQQQPCRFGRPAGIARRFGRRVGAAARCCRATAHSHSRNSRIRNRWSVGSADQAPVAPQCRAPSGRQRPPRAAAERQQRIQRVAR